MASKHQNPSDDISFYFQSNIPDLIPIPPRAGTSSIQVYKYTDNPTKSWSILKVKVNSDKVVQPIAPSDIPEGSTRFVCISDTHGKTDTLDIPSGDVLIHAGDFTQRGLPQEVTKFNEFLGRLPHKYKIVIAGNHDISFETDKYSHLLWSTFSHPKKYNSSEIKQSLRNCIYLEDCGVEVLGFKIFGSPWQPEFQNWGFNLIRGGAILKKWDQIPEDIDVLVTHGPPVGQGDLTKGGIRSGCVELLKTVRERVKPRYHIFGHIHEAYGVTTDGYTTYINASTCNLHYKPLNPPVVFDIQNTVKSDVVL
ncbi:Metallophosphoesterase domain-containing protein 1 [Oopsacas minuta]|uniref:Metallophosphoesterase domain-containing protein 1 n=1 Tax=Oopsacas minuta TaxID=111878 RepID=A0AAV7K5E7_9METZ|nr:Metallophosphoesterase domain-containing protein 1 [Oopsacas minuta]